MTRIQSVELILHSTPPSLNRLGTRGNHWQVTRAKKQLQTDLEGLLMASRLPRGLQHVTATVTLRFPVRRRRDAENHVWLIAKALGDACQAGGWIPDDTPEHFRCATLLFDPDLGAARTTIRLARW